MRKYKKGILNTGYSWNCNAYDFNFIPIKTYSAKYLKGVEKAFTAIVDASLVYAVKLFNPYRGYMLNNVKINNFPILSSKFQKIDKVFEKYKKNISNSNFNIFIGSDHAITYKILSNFYIDKKFSIMQFDAHSDFIDDYKNYPHGAVMKECSKLDCVEKLFQVGLRANLNHGIAIPDSLSLGNIIVSRKTLEELDYSLNIKKQDLYLTIDIDFFDPSIAEATNTMEPGGVKFNDAVKLFENIIKNNNIIGIDIVEFNPKIKDNGKTANMLINIIIYLINFLSQKNTVSAPFEYDDEKVEMIY